MTTLENRPNTALLVVDVQNGVVKAACKRDAVVANIASPVETPRRESRDSVIANKGSPLTSSHSFGGVASCADRGRGETASAAEYTLHRFAGMSRHRRHRRARRFQTSATDSVPLRFMSYPSGGCWGAIEVRGLEWSCARLSA